jgi:hypothetical protein
MGQPITICHWNESGTWNPIEISTNALNGHTNHEMDIWPPVEGVTPGMNWPQGEVVYLNDCVLAATTPPPEPSPSPSLPESGAAVSIALLMVLFLLTTGTVLMVLSRKPRKKSPPDG